MPYIELKTNIEVTDAKVSEIHTLLGREIELIPGKTEKWLMTDIRGGEKMSFAGSDAPCVIAEVSIFGKATAESYENLTASLCEKLGSALDVGADRIYIKYEEVSVWGWNGANF